MTEVVDKQMESMLEELEEMQKVKLYTAEETRVVMIKRKNFEQKINTTSKADITNFTEYINYEQLLLDNIRLRRSRRNINEKKANIEHKIIKRIQNLYEMAFQRFSEDLSLFLSFLKFCKRMNYVNAASEVVQNMVKMHADNPQIWQIAANWHANDRRDVVMAKTILLKGLAIHKDNKPLYLEMIQMELFEATKIIQPEEKVARQKTCIDKLEKVLCAIFKFITDSEFHIELLQMFEKHAFTKSLQDMIRQHLVECNSDNENVWHILAQRERTDTNSENENTESGNTKRTPKARLEACFAKYKEGLSKVSPAVKPRLWELYIDLLFQLQEDGNGAGTVLKLRTLKEALNEALQEGNLVEKHYIAWLKMINDHRVSLQIIENGVKVHPESSELWLARLSYEIDHNDTPSTVQKVFEKGAAALTEKGLPLWLAMLRYHYLTSNENAIEKLYKDSVEQPSEIAHTMVPLYLEFLVLKRGIGTARKLYKSFCMKKPYCKELHLMMLRLESMQIDANYQEWGEVHKLACEQFGDEDVDVWINYIEFYLHYNKKNEKTMECVEQIRKQATENLSKELICLFEARFDIVRAIA